MTYATFLLLFLGLPILVLGGLLRLLRPSEMRRHGVGIAILCAVAFVWTSPWDNYLVAREIWGYGADRVIATVLHVPVEEYLFFLLQPILTGFLLLLLIGQRDLPSGECGKPQTALRTSFAVAGLLLFAGGCVALAFESGTYAGLILIWAVPPLIIQWLFDPGFLVRCARLVAAGTALPTVFLSLADSLAIDHGIWFIAEPTSSGFFLGNLPVEEVLFFLITNLLVVQGLLLWRSLKYSERFA